jgi:hypothetical protein
MNRKYKLQALSIEYRVNFGNGRHKTSPRKKPAIKPRQAANKLPRITRLLALAHHLQDLIDQGIVDDYADIARLSGITRSRVTQLMNLGLLAPAIQEEILSFTESSVVSIKEQGLRKILKTPIWQEQAKIWKEIKTERL